MNNLASIGWTYNFSPYSLSNSSSSDIFLCPYKTPFSMICLNVMTGIYEFCKISLLAESSKNPKIAPFMLGTSSSGFVTSILTFFEKLWNLCVCLSNSHLCDENTFLLFPVHWSLISLAHLNSFLIDSCFCSFISGSDCNSSWLYYDNLLLGMRIL